MTIILGMETNFERTVVLEIVANDDVVEETLKQLRAADPKHHVTLGTRTPDTLEDAMAEIKPYYEEDTDGEKS